MVAAVVAVVGDLGVVVGAVIPGPLAAAVLAVTAAKTMWIVAAFDENAAPETVAGFETEQAYGSDAKAVAARVVVPAPI